MTADEYGSRDVPCTEDDFFLGMDGISFTIVNELDASGHEIITNSFVREHDTGSVSFSKDLRT